jgi:hypothetical protein
MISTKKQTPMSKNKHEYIHILIIYSSIRMKRLARTNSRSNREFVTSLLRTLIGKVPPHCIPALFSLRARQPPNSLG